MWKLCEIQGSKLVLIARSQLLLWQHQKLLSSIFSLTLNTRKTCLGIIKTPISNIKRCIRAKCSISIGFNLFHGPCDTLVNFFPQASNWIFFIHFTRNYHYLEFDWLLVTASLKGTFTAWKVSKYRVFCGISPYSVQMRGNTDQKNSVFGHVSRSD